MRKLKLLLAAGALLLGAGQTWAQTDVTNTYITNADFSSTDGWTQEHPSGTYWALGNGLIGTYAVANDKKSTTDDTHLATEYCLGMQCRWRSNYANFTQTTSTLLSGVYTLTFDVENTNASNNVTYNNLFSVKVGETTYTDSKKEWMSGSTGWTTHTISFTLEQDATATISFGYGTGDNNIGTGSTPHLYVSHLRLTYQSLLDGVKTLWENAKAKAQAAVANGTYANVTGDELTAINAEINKAEPTTKEGYENATTALEEATAAFIAAAPSYDAFIAAKNADTPNLVYANPDKKEDLEEAKAVTATSATDAATKAAAITTALRAYYESHALAEGVNGAVNMSDRIKNASDPQNNNDWTWTGKKNNPASNEPWTDANGTNKHSYFDGGDWSNSTWTTTMTQTISIPAGKYLLTAKARAATNVTFTMSVGEASVDLPHVGSAGNVFDRGWGDASVEFETDGSDAEIFVSASSNTIHEWFSISDFRLVRLQLYTQMADAEDYAALNDAISSAEAKTLGFLDGEYAPYNNVEAIKALAEAKSIDQNAENSKEDVESLTAKLTNWTANVGEVDAIYDGQFANTEANTTSGDITLPGWTKVDGIRLLVKDQSTDPGLAYTDGKAAVFSWGGTTLTYGEQTGYTLPMVKNTVYQLTFKVSGWRDGDLPSYVSVDLDGVVQPVEPGTVSRINDAEGNPFATMKFFVTPTKANSILKIFANKHFTIADLSLKQAVAEEVTINEDKENAFIETYANVTLQRTLSASYWNTFSVPFDMAIPTGWTVKEFESAEDNVLNFKDAQGIVAGKPYLVKPETDYTGGTFEGVIVKSTEGITEGKGDYKFAAQIYNKELATDGTVAYLATDGKIKKLTSGGIKGLRAYFIVPAKANIANARIAFIGDETTGISEVKNQNNVEGVYDLNGRRVQTLKKGIYVVNGKKVVK